MNQCMKCETYARIFLLSKLKYVGMKMEDLLPVNKTFIRCIVEYCCVEWHSSLTVHQNNALERIHRVCLIMILGKDYVGYISALESCELETLESRRAKLSLSFAKKCIKSSKIVISSSCCSSPTWTSTTPPGAVLC